MYCCEIYHIITVFRNDMIDLLVLFVFASILVDGINN
jgi:hypothetical protein